MNHNLNLLFLLVASGLPALGSLPETHFFKVRANLNYRCYRGYDNKKIFKDSHTGRVCDNQEYRKTLIEKVVPIKIQVQATPDNDPTLAGRWSEKVEFKGRTFEATLSLFKRDKKSGPQYRAQLTAQDDNPSSRQTVTLIDFFSPKQMNPVTLRVQSMGSPEEIALEVEYAPAK